jgi:hypothetical protein
MTIRQLRERKLDATSDVLCSELDVNLAIKLVGEEPANDLHSIA